MTFFTYYQRFNDLRVMVETKKMNDDESILYEFLNGLTYHN